METQRRQQLVVGGFLLGGLIVALTTIFMLGADKAVFREYSRLHVYFDQVQGLAKGSVVSLSGVVIGNVENIEFMNETKTLDVTMKVENRYMGRIANDSQVEIRTQGALGDKFVFIIPGTIGNSTVKDGDTLSLAPATDIFSIVSDRGKDATKFFDIINELYIMTKSINNERRLERIMGSLAHASQNLDAASEQAKKIAVGFGQTNPEQRLSRTLERFENIMTKIDKGQGSLGALINDPSVHERLKAMLGGSTRKSHVKDLLRTSIEKSEDQK